MGTDAGHVIECDRIDVLVAGKGIGCYLHHFGGYRIVLGGVSGRHAVEDGTVFRRQAITRERISRVGGNT